MAKQSDQGAIKRVVDFDELYPGRFLKAADLGKGKTLTITDAYLEELHGDKGKEWKGVVTLRETNKQWVLNKTNGLCLKELFGRDVTKWAGHKVSIYPALHDGEPCIRVFGSPELEADRTFELKLPRKAPRMVTLKAVRPAGVPNTKAPATAPAAEPPATPHDPDTGEVRDADGDPEPKEDDPF